MISGAAVRQRLIEEGLLSPSGRGKPSLKMREEDHAIARRHLLVYFGQPFVEIEQEQDNDWSQFIDWLGAGEEE